jgi:Tol biopolymer transport system component
MLSYIFKQMLFMRSIQKNCRLLPGLILLILLLPILTVAQLGACTLDHDHEKEDEFFLPVMSGSTHTAAAELPLKGERIIRINTTEGSWLSLDVSPDGKTIIFAMLGDLYQIPFTGGKAKQITSGLGFDSQPRYSPDGKSIAYISDDDGAENAWIMDLATGNKKVLTKSRDEYYQSAEWTPDGNYLVVAKGVGTPRLHLFHKDGGAGSLLTSAPADLKAIEPAFGSNGKQVWFSRRKGMWDYNAQMPQYQLSTLDLETGETEIKTSRYGSAFAPTLSSDGKWLVYGTRYNTETGLVLHNLATAEEKWLAYPVQHDDQESLASMGVLPAMSFTPDNKQVVASYGGKIYSVAIDGSGAKEIPFQVETEIKIGPQLSFKYPIKDDKEITANQIRDAVFSPNGKQVVFAALGHLYLMDYPAGTPVRLTNMDVSEAEPVWSPDGKYIAFTTSDGKNGALYSIAVAAGSKVVKLSSEDGSYQDPVWTPDGSRIVYFRGPSAGAGGGRGAGARQSLYWLPAAGGKATYIAQGVGSNPHFAKDSDRIYLFSAQEGLISIGWNADGKDKRTHVKLTGHTIYAFANTNGGQFTFFRRTASATTIIKAPVGDKALAQISNEVYLITLPPVGEETPVISLTEPSRASFPSWKITEIGAEFPSWSADGKTVYWSLGRSLFTYDIAKMSSEGYTASETKLNVLVKNDIPEAEILLKGARIITMKGDEVIEKGDILIRNNRIAGVGVSGTLSPSGKAQVIDVSGKTITPGFFDLHAHMGAGRASHPSQPAAYAANLAYGVTTTRNPQPGTTDILTFDNLVTTGKILGPRIYSTGPGVAYWAYNIKDLDHARRILKQYSEYFNTKTIKMYAVGNRQQRQWIIMAAKEQGLMPTTEGNLDMKLNFTEVLDGYPGHEHTYPMFPLYKDAVEFIAKSGIAFTSTFLLDYGGPCAENYFFEREDVVHDKKLGYFTPKDELDRKGRRRNSWFAEEEYIFPREAKIVGDILKAGGLPAVGAHGQLQGLGFHWEMWATQSGGMRNIDVIRTATINGAKGIGLDGDLGSLETGKLADLVIMDKNPLENIRNTNTIKYVMRNGRLYDASNLAEIAPRKTNPPQFEWMKSLMPGGLPGVK